MQSRSGLWKIAKGWKKFKELVLGQALVPDRTRQMRNLRFLGQLFLAMGLSLGWMTFVPLPAAGEIVQTGTEAGDRLLPLVLAWQVPLSKTEVYKLEIARDPGFGTIVHRADIEGLETYGWQAPGEGVYHWRLARPGQKGQGQEVITFVSGSFAAIDPELQRKEPARLTWEAEKGADSYKLYVVDQDGKSRIMKSETASFTVPATDRSLMIEVVPYSGEQRLFRYYHFNPTLKIEAGLAAPSPTATPSPAPSPTATPSPAPSPEPSAPPAPEAAPAPAASGVGGTESVEIADSPRVHLVEAFAFSGTEQLQLQKLEVDLKDRKSVAGPGLAVWINPVKGLVIDLFGTYHEHRGILTAPDLFPDGEIPLRASRFTADLGVGWDAFSPWNSRWHRLVFSLQASELQLPLLPTRYQASSGELPSLKKQAFSLWGGALAYGYYGDPVALVLHGGVLQDPRDDARMVFQKLLLDWRVGVKTTIHLGALLRTTVASVCDSDRETCLAEGESKVAARERFGILGIGVVLR